MRIVILFAAAWLLLLIMPWWLSPPSVPVISQGSESPEALPADMMNEPIQPIPFVTSSDKHKVALGERLFSEPQLSHDNSISCTSCHILHSGGTDNKPHSLKLNGKLTAVNTLTVFNAALNFKLNWTGEFNNFEDHSDRVLKVNMNATWPEVIAKLKADPSYVSDFNKLYPDGMQVHTVKDALASYERSLITPNSRFDKFLRGDAQAINEEEKRGYRLFKSYGCVACHQGINAGGNMYQKIGVMRDYFGDDDRADVPHNDRFRLTGQDADRDSFRVPSLRNVALTAPYLHDGSVKNLADAVDVMAKYQLGRRISLEDKNAIIAFLKTLTGEFNGRLLAYAE